MSTSPSLPIPDSSNIEALLARVPPFAEASAAGRTLLAGSARRQRIASGAAIWRAGEPPLSFAFVRKGLVKMVRPRAGGRKDIVGIFGPGEAIGVVTVLRDIPYPVDAIAATAQVEVVHLPRADVMELSYRELDFAGALALSCAERAARMRDMHGILSAGGVESRLAAFLLDLAERFGDSDSDDGQVHIPISLSRSELAACTATTTESAIRTLSQWARKGLVRTDPSGFVIGSTDELQALAERPMIRGSRPVNGDL